MEGLPKKAYNWPYQQCPQWDSRAAKLRCKGNICTRVPLEMLARLDPVNNIVHWTQGRLTPKECEGSVYDTHIYIFMSFVKLHNHLNFENWGFESWFSILSHVKDKVKHSHKWYRWLEYKVCICIQHDVTRFMSCVHGPNNNFKAVAHKLITQVMLWRTHKVLYLHLCLQWT